MISTCINNDKPWSSHEQLDVKIDYSNGKSIESIAKKYKRHSNAVCLELIRQRLMNKDSPENVSKRHTRFDDSSDDETDIYDPYDLKNHFELSEYFFLKIKQWINWMIFLNSFFETLRVNRSIHN